MRYSIVFSNVYIEFGCCRSTSPKPLTIVVALQSSAICKHNGGILVMRTCYSLSASKAWPPF